MSTRPALRVSERRRVHRSILSTISIRMARGSILLRFWAVLLVGALLGVSADPAHARFAWLAVFLVAVCWLFDAYLGRQARLYEKAGERVNRLPDTELDWSLDTSPVDGDDVSLASRFSTRALFAFYGVLLVSIAVVRATLAIGA